MTINAIDQETVEEIIETLERSPHDCMVDWWLDERRRLQMRLRQVEDRLVSLAVREQARHV